MDVNSTVARKELYGEQVTTFLRDAIVRGAFPAGRRLIEVSVAKQFGVSGPIREAFRRLAAEGLVELRSPGVFVIGISSSDIDNLYALREAIETLAFKLAIKVARPSDWDPMERLVARLSEAAEEGDVESVAQADIDIHACIYTISANRYLLDVWRHYAPIIGSLLRATILGHADLRDPAERHSRLLKVLRSGDLAAGLAELKDHLEDSHQRMLKAHAVISGAAASGRLD